MTNFVDGETLLAAGLNAAFAAVTPPASDLLGGSGTAFTQITVGSGLVLSGGTLTSTGGTLVALAAGSNISLSGSSTVTISVAASPQFTAVANTAPVGIVGAGTTISATDHPDNLLVMQTNSGDTAFDLVAFSGNPGLSMERANGTSGAPTAVQSGDVIGVIRAGGYTGVSWGGSLFQSGLVMSATGAWSAGSRPADLSLWVTNVGGMLATPKARLTEDGHFLAGTTTDDGSGAALQAPSLSIAGLMAGGTLELGSSDPFSAFGSGLTISAGTLSATAAGGSVTKVSTATPITGGDITTTGTISLNHGAGLHVTSGTLAADWSAGTVTAVGSGINISGGTITSSAPGGTVTEVVAGTGLSGGTITSAGTIALTTRTASTLMGNPGTVAAIPTDVAIGSGLSLSTAGTLTATGSGGSVTKVSTATPIAGGDITTAGTISLNSGAGLHVTSGTLIADWNGGTVTSVGAGLAITSGTIAATGTAGVSSIVAGTGLSGGTITSAGTIALATRTASTIMGNPGTAAATPSDVTIGTGLSLSTAGTLTATGGSGSVTSVVSGAGLHAGTITTSGTLLADWNAGTVAALGTGLAISSSTLSPQWQAGSVTALGGAMAINSGTISAQNQGTITLSGTTTGTINPAGVDSFLVNNGTAAGTIAISPGFQGQRLRVEIKQGATAHTITFTSTVSFGTTVTSYTATNTAAARDLIQLFCVNGTSWALSAVSQGFTI